MILTLTPNEATILHIILERIAGCETTSGRKHTYTLLRKLEQAGETYSAEKESFFPVSADFCIIHFK